jgi:hypothetical protein
MITAQDVDGNLPDVTEETNESPLAGLLVSRPTFETGASQIRKKCALSTL